MSRSGRLALLPANGVIEGNDAERPRLLTGCSPIEFAEREISAEQTLLGDRFLCRGGGLFIVAPSGHGKSVFAIQSTILWSCGKTAFGIRPAQPLQILVIQAEDDDGDVKEMCASSINGLGLTEGEKELVKKNAHIEFVNDLTSAEFIKALKGFLEQRPVDLVMINPYTAYLGADIKDDAANSRFLRNQLNPLLKACGVGVLIIHHTPKTNRSSTENYAFSDWSYHGAGAAVLTNWARGYIVIDPCKDATGVYRFIAAKRGKRTGWPTTERYFAHSTEPGQLLWLEANRDQIALAKEKSKKDKSDLLTLIPPLDPISQVSLFEKAKQMGIGKHKVRDFVAILIEEEKIFQWKIRRIGVKSGVGYAQRKEPLSENVSD
jgi:hypothetical protein